MDAWTTTDVETLLAVASSIEIAAWALHNGLTTLVLIASIFLGWNIGGQLAPSRGDWGV